jgi:hypothetical protein
MEHKVQGAPFDQPLLRHDQLPRCPVSSEREMKDKPLYGDRRLATERDLRAGNMNYR